MTSSKIEPYELVTVPNPILKETALDVDLVDDTVRMMLSRMVLTMREHDGAGLAANQVGLLWRLIVIEADDASANNEPLKLINPKITWMSEDQEPYPQGCLSLPGVYSDVVRPREITFEYVNEFGDKVEGRATGTLCHCLQHEIDHLNGVLFVDHLSALKKKILTQRAIKHAKSGKL